MHDVSGRLVAQEHERPLVRDEDVGKGMLIVVPLYKGPELLVALSRALFEMADELRALGATILFINDSPDYAALAAELDRTIPMLAATIDVRLLANSENHGFVRTVNRGMALALKDGRDVLLLNSDTVPRPGAFSEMAAVAQLDPMIGTVSPRSDNATICDSPYFDELRNVNPQQTYAAHRFIAEHLPRFTYVPTTVGFCMLVRWLMLEEFGLFDEAYGAGYNEEIDFVRRINRCGYRAVLANHAYVHHVGEASFSQSGLSRAERNDANLAILLERYPEAPKTIQLYFDGPDYQAQRLLGGLVPSADGRLNVLFDCRKLELYHSGTHEHMVALLRAFVGTYQDRYVSHVVCEEEAFRFHELASIPGLAYVAEREVFSRRFAAVMRIGQPFQLRDLELLEGAAPIAGVLMLDTIALDCQHLDEVGLGVLWQRLCTSIDTLGFNSRFSADQFNRRFIVPDRIVQFTSLCSTDMADYAPAASNSIVGDAVLVVGNHFHHKHVRATVDALRDADPCVPILVLGVRCEGDGIESHESGLLPDEMVASLYDRARVVLLPSHYEGFGLPIMHGLARRRPVVARNLPSAREIGASCSAGANLHLAETTQELVRLALRSPAWQETPGEAPPIWSWTEAAGAIADGIAASSATFDYNTCFSRRIFANTARLRLALAASSELKFADLPNPGQGYMLGRALDEHLDNQRTVPMLTRFRVKIGFALHPEHALARAVPQLARSLWRLRLRAEDATINLDEVQRRLLRCLARLRLGGQVQLRVAQAIATADGDGEPDPMTGLRLLLLASGLMIDRLVQDRGWLIAQGSKVTDWQAMLPGPQDDLHFVHYLYRQFLGRHPDADGVDNYVAELANGCNRADLIETFLCSAERKSMIARQLARRAYSEVA